MHIKSEHVFREFAEFGINSFLTVRRPLASPWSLLKLPIIQVYLTLNHKISYLLIL